MPRLLIVALLACLVSPGSALAAGGVARQAGGLAVTGTSGNDETHARLANGRLVVGDRFGVVAGCESLTACPLTAPGDDLTVATGGGDDIVQLSLEDWCDDYDFEGVDCGDEYVPSEHLDRLTISLGEGSDSFSMDGPGQRIVEHFDGDGELTGTTAEPHIPATIDAGAGDDVIVASNGETDSVVCGPGDDTVYADGNMPAVQAPGWWWPGLVADSVAGDCEHVRQWDTAIEAGQGGARPDDLMVGLGTDVDDVTNRTTVVPYDYYTNDWVGETYEYRLDGGNWTPFSLGSGIAVTGDGEHTLGLRMRLADGRRGLQSDVESWTLDTVAPTAKPVARVLPPAVVDAYAVQIAFWPSGSADEWLECRVDSVDRGEQGAWRTCDRLSRVYDEGVYELRARFVDEAGNGGPELVHRFTVVAYSEADPDDGADGDGSGSTSGAANAGGAPVQPAGPAAPRLSIPKTVKAKGGKAVIGVSSPVAATVTLTVKQGRKTLTLGKAKGRGKVAVKLTAKGKKLLRKAGRKGLKVTVTARHAGGAAVKAVRLRG